MAITTRGRFGVVSRGPGERAVSLASVSLMRRCSRTACQRPAVATLTYVYADSTAVLGPLATFAEPHTYDLCGQHAERLTAPRGWEMVRLLSRFDDLPEAEDDLLAVVDALREQTVRDRTARQAPATPATPATDPASQGRPGPQGQRCEDYPDQHSGRHRSSGSRASVGGPRPDRGDDRRPPLRVLPTTSVRSAEL